MKLRHPLVSLVCLLGALLPAGPSAAATFTYYVVGGGLDDGHACLSTAGAGSCAAEAKFAFGPSDSFPITGSITYDDVAGTIDIDITLATASMPGSYDGVTSVEFTNVHYVVNDMSGVLFSGQLLGTAKTGTVGGVVNSAPGTYEQLNGVTTVVGPDAIGPAAVGFGGLTCGGLGGVGLCGLTVGASRDFQLNVGTTAQGGGVFGDSLDFVHTFNFNVVIPEPATGGLLALGVVTLSLTRRRR